MPLAATARRRDPRGSAGRRCGERTRVARRRANAAAAECASARFPRTCVPPLRVVPPIAAMQCAFTR
ncbi:hypothetical protein EGT86_37890 [Burkholderia pseudomallei]|nr:hypothetical protein EGT86_37890 [Burkholderia pseudomallei]